jgi:hypothetical protein
MKSNEHGTQGFSLIEVLVVGGLLTIVGLGLASIVSTMNNQSLALQQKMDLSEIKVRIERTFINYPNVCGSVDWPIINMTFSSVGVTTATSSADTPTTAAAIYEGPSSLNNQILAQKDLQIGSVKIESISLTDIRKVDNSIDDRFSANLTIGAYQSKGVAKLRPVTYKVLLQTDMNTPRRITNCFTLAPTANTLGDCQETPMSCSPTCPPDHPFVGGVTLCSMNTFATSGLADPNDCAEGCGNGPHGDQDQPKYRLKCCLLQ